MGLILKMDMTLRLDMMEEGDELVQDIVGERGPVWIIWIGIAVSNTVASLLSEVPAGELFQITIDKIDGGGEGVME